MTETLGQSLPPDTAHVSTRFCFFSESVVASNSQFDFHDNIPSELQASALDHMFAEFESHEHCLMQPLGCQCLSSDLEIKHRL